MSGDMQVCCVCRGHHRVQFTDILLNLEALGSSSRSAWVSVNDSGIMLGIRRGGGEELPLRGSKVKIVSCEWKTEGFKKDKGEAELLEWLDFITSSNTMLSHSKWNSVCVCLFVFPPPSTFHVSECEEAHTLTSLGTINQTHCGAHFLPPITPPPQHKTSFSRSSTAVDAVTLVIAN